MKPLGYFARRDFIRTSALAGAGALLGSSEGILSAQIREAVGNTPSKGLAARDESGKLSPWSFERRSLGDDNVLIDIKFCGSGGTP
jgi:uncharacterized zinc-type alcohol dehydrogenase-like protein